MIGVLVLFMVDLLLPPLANCGVEDLTPLKLSCDLAAA
jgi:hypothetical protein